MMEEDKLPTGVPEGGQIVFQPVPLLGTRSVVHVAVEYREVRSAVVEGVPEVGLRVIEVAKISLVG